MKTRKQKIVIGGLVGAGLIGLLVAEAISQEKIHERVQALSDKTMRDLVFVQGGTFQMGDFGELVTPEKLPFTSHPENRPLHAVTLDSFSMGRYKITYDDFDVYTDANGLPKIRLDDYYAAYRAVPNVGIGVNWQEASDYCKWLSKITGHPFDLPTEAQWEFAARNRGGFIKFPTNNGQYKEGENVPSPEQLQQMMPGQATPWAYPVGKFPPTPLGLYDMGFGGWEWMSDWFDKNYYSHSPVKNPRGPESGDKKAHRGQGEGFVDSGLTIFRSSSTMIPVDASPFGKTDRLVSDTFRCVLNEPKATHP